MTRFHKLFLAVAIMGILAFALKIRIDEAGYKNYYSGNFAEALSGLVARAEGGESSAAMLVGNIYALGSGLDIDREKASTWYLKQAQMGDISGVRFFVQNALQEFPVSAKDRRSQHCQTVVELLDLAARAGDLGANIELGEFYETGLCVELSFAKAAIYFQTALRIDHRFSFLLNRIRQKLTESDRAQLNRGLPPARVKPSASMVLGEMIRSVPVLRAPVRINK